MRIALAQIDSTVGAFKENAEKIIEYTHRAKERRCDLVVFPELALFGYAPADLLERKSVADEQRKALRNIEKKLPPDIGVIFGAVTSNTSNRGRPFYNSALFLEKGKNPKVFHKELLPNYDIFDEYRHFESGDIKNNYFRFRGKNILITICEDIWAWTGVSRGVSYPRNPLLKLKGKKVDVVLNLSASPFSLKKFARRKAVAKKTSAFFKAPIVYVNLVGAQDEVVFDGGSFALDQKGKLLAQSVFFEEDLNVVDLDQKVGGKRLSRMSDEELLRQALVLGLRDFFEKNGFKRAHLGLSGGIDSAVVACLAVDAFGPGRVTGLALPSQFNSPESELLAKELSQNLGISFKILPIQAGYECLIKTIETTFGSQTFGVAHENLQARLRGLLLMAYSNLYGSLLLSTGNKSEYATGYSTLYGDMCGGIAPIADLLKEQVYALARHYNCERVIIPEKIITRAPTAELRPNQKDQDTLPPYESLDRIVERLVEKQSPAKTPEEKWVLERMYLSEFKRWQAPPILRISDHAFGRGRRLPITNKARI